MTKSTEDSNTPEVKITEDPEEVASKEAGKQTPAPTEPDAAESSEESLEVAVAEEANSSVHVPHTVSKRKV